LDRLKDEAAQAPPWDAPTACACGALH
jgi:hypothetical protein